ncbi:MAG: hypothetical protein CMH61_02565 [Nanoarchaeota archaeon]|nr:hypothetical protein [Nanoarchaeota archaeon]|tara:strand:+ start:2041 stop:2478 length:438 start_codon:yes stop_codon:yes gene_type:complete
MNAQSMDDIVEHNYQLMISREEGGMVLMAESVGGSGGVTKTGGRTIANYSFFFEPHTGEMVGFYLERNARVPDSALQGIVKLVFPPLQDLRPERYGATDILGYPDVPLTSLEVSGEAIAVLERTRKVYSERQQGKVKEQLEKLGL